MPSFMFKVRTADSYLAGIGASGALIASAFVLLVVLVGIVTFDSWPRAGQLITGADGNIALDNVTAQAPAAPRPQAPNLAALLGGPATPALAAPPAGAPGRVVSRPRPNRGAGPVSGQISPQGNGGGTVTVPPRQPQPPTQSGGGGNAVTRTLSGLGNNVESDTNELGNTLGGSSSPGLGGLVGGVGRTVNNTLQALAGNR